MKVFHLKKVSLMALFLFAVSCGGSQASKQDGDDDGNTDDTGSICQSNDDCPISGFCNVDVCMPCNTCNDDDCTLYEFDAHCSAGEYCNKEGRCVDHCVNDDDCDFGQECFTEQGRCLGGDSCSLTSECGTMEVCLGGLCSAPPENCRFPEECPIGWVCNSTGQNGVCQDPDAPIGVCFDESNAGGNACANHPDICGSVGDECVCESGLCQLRPGECDPSTYAEDCDTDEYCSSSFECDPALPCDSTASDGGNSTCVPHGLICDNDYCVNAPTCTDPGSSASCSVENINAQLCECPNSADVCFYNQNPPVCLREGMGECDRDSLCPDGEYCNLFYQACEIGCRDSADCVGNANCAGGTCCCVGDTSNKGGHICGPSPTGDGMCPSMGNTCTDDAQCIGGEICACEGLEIPILGCMATQRCYQVCDRVADLIAKQCRNPMQCCGSATMNPILQYVLDFLGSFLTSDSTTAACLPGPDENGDGIAECPKLFGDRDKDSDTDEDSNTDDDSNSDNDSNTDNDSNSDNDGNSES